jgi:hypothetical protein
MGENSKGLLKEITEFGNPSVEDFVSAIHRVTHGDLRKLQCDHLPTNCICGNISELLCRKNKPIYRKLIATI